MEKKQHKSRMKDPGKTVYVGNLGYNRNEKGIDWLFSYYGKVRSIQIITDKKTEKSKGIAFVRMVYSKDALRAIKNLNGKVVDGRTLKVSEAIENDPPEKIVKPVDTPKKVIKKKKKPESGLDTLFKYLQQK